MNLAIRGRMVSLTTAVLVLGASLFASSANGSGVPVLAGPWSTYQEGYGHARPKRIFNGGDDSGLLQEVRWATWGHAKAIGEG
jgi:hypothetical protein